MRSQSLKLSGGSGDTTELKHLTNIPITSDGRSVTAAVESGRRDVGACDLPTDTSLDGDRRSLDANAETTGRDVQSVVAEGRRDTPFGGIPNYVTFADNSQILLRASEPEETPLSSDGLQSRRGANSGHSVAGQQDGEQRNSNLPYSQQPTFEMDALSSLDSCNSIFLPQFAEARKMSLSSITCDRYLTCLILL